MKKRVYLLLSLCLMFCTMLTLTGCGKPKLTGLLMSHNGEKSAIIHRYYEYGDELTVMYDMELFATYNDGSETKVLGEGVEISDEDRTTNFVIEYFCERKELIESTPEGNWYSSHYEKIDMLPFKPDVGGYLVEISYKGSSKCSLYINIGQGNNPNTYTPHLQVDGVSHANTTQYGVGSEEGDISITLTRAGNDVSNLIDKSYFITEETYKRIIGDNQNYALLKDYNHVMDTIAGDFLFGNSANCLDVGKWYLFCTTNAEGNYKQSISQFVPITARPGEYRFNSEAGTLKLKFNYNDYIFIHDEQTNSTYNTHPFGDVRVEDCFAEIELNEGYETAFTLNGVPCEADTDYLLMGKIVAKNNSGRINYNKNGQNVYVTMQLNEDIKNYVFANNFYAKCEIVRREVDVPELQYGNQTVSGTYKNGAYVLNPHTVEIDYDLDYYTSDDCPIELLEGSSNLTNSAVNTYSRTYKLKDPVNFMWTYNFREVTEDTFTDENCDEKNLLEHIYYNPSTNHITLSWVIDKNIAKTPDSIWGVDFYTDFYNSEYVGNSAFTYDQDIDQLCFCVTPLLDGETYFILDNNTNAFYCSDINQIKFTIKKDGTDVTSALLKERGTNFTYVPSWQTEEYNTLCPYWKLDFLYGTLFDGAGNYTIEIEIKDHPMLYDYSFSVDFRVPYIYLNCHDYYGKTDYTTVVPRDIKDGTTLKSLIGYLDEYSDLFSYTVELRESNLEYPNDRTKDTVTTLDVNEYVFNLANFDSSKQYYITVNYIPTPKFVPLVKGTTFTGEIYVVNAD